MSNQPKNLELGVTGQISALGFIRIPLNAVITKIDASRKVTISPTIYASVAELGFALIRVLGGSGARWNSPAATGSAFGVHASISVYIELK
jgi:hypothetical protein